MRNPSQNSWGWGPERLVLQMRLPDAALERKRGRRFSGAALGVLLHALRVGLLRPASPAERCESRCLGLLELLLFLKL